MQQCKQSKQKNIWTISLNVFLYNCPFGFMQLLICFHVKTFKKSRKRNSSIFLDHNLVVKCISSKQQKCGFFRHEILIKNVNFLYTTYLYRVKKYYRIFFICNKPPDGQISVLKQCCTQICIIKNIFFSFALTETDYFGRQRWTMISVALPVLSPSWFFKIGTHKALFIESLSSSKQKPYHVMWSTQLFLEDKKEKQRITGCSLYICIFFIGFGSHRFICNRAWGFYYDLKTCDILLYVPEWKKIARRNLIV